MDYRNIFWLIFGLFLIGEGIYFLYHRNNPDKFKNSLLGHGPNGFILILGGILAILGFILF